MPSTATTSTAAPQPPRAWSPKHGKVHRRGQPWPRASGPVKSLPQRPSVSLSAQTEAGACARHEPLVRKAYALLAPRGGDYALHQDLMQEGRIGLLDAIRRAAEAGDIDPCDTYLYARISGAMLDAMRRDNVIPRHIHERMRLIERARLIRRTQGGRCTDQMIADMTGLDVDQVLVADMANAFRHPVPIEAMSFDVLSEFLAAQVRTDMDPEGILIGKQLIERLNDSLGQIDPVDAFVFEQIVLAERRACDVAEQIGVSPSRISQRIKRASAAVAELLAR